VRNIPIIVAVCAWGCACSMLASPGDVQQQQATAGVDSVLAHIRWEQKLHIRVRLSMIYGTLEPPDSLLLGQVMRRFSALAEAEQLCRKVRSDIASGSIMPEDTLAWKNLQGMLQEIDRQLMKEKDLKPSDNNRII